MLYPHIELPQQYGEGLAPSGLARRQQSTTESRDVGYPDTNKEVRRAGRGSGQRTVTAAEKAQAREVSLRRIGRLFAPYRWQLGIVTAIIAASSVVGLASPFLLRAVLDNALPERNLRLLVWLVIAMVAVAAITSAFGVIQTWISTKVGQQVMHELRTNVFGHLQRQSIAFFTRTRTGEVQSRITNDIGGMESVVTSTATSIASNLTTAVATAWPWSPCPGSSR